MRRELRRENEELRGALGLRGYRTIDEWERLPATIRDPLAARAFIADWGDYSRALDSPWLPAMNRLPPDKVSHYKDHVACVFETPGVQTTVRRSLERLDVEREAILSRQLQVALYGENAESTKAATLLIKVCG